jgi:hypothetical protein
MPWLFFLLKIADILHSYLSIQFVSLIDQNIAWCSRLANSTNNILNLVFINYNLDFEIDKRNPASGHW